MKKLLIPTVLACTLAAAAQAVPIHIDFTGTVSGGTIDSPIGAAASGGFRIDTDQFMFSGAASGIQYSWVAWQPAITQPLAWLNVGASNYIFPSGDDYYAVINFADGCQPLCNLGWVENFNVGAYNRADIAPDFTGIARSQSVSFYSLYQTALPNFPYWQGYDQFVGSQMLPIDVLSLPLGGRTDVGFLETTWNCVAGNCREQSALSFTITLDSLTRSSPSQSVPEPGTLGLFGMALAGIFAARRRKRDKPV
jgi:hypothetical protein